MKHYPITIAADAQTLKLQLVQALIALAQIEAETKGPMRQTELLAIITAQRDNIYAVAAAAEF